MNSIDGGKKSWKYPHIINAHPWLKKYTKKYLPSSFFAFHSPLYIFIRRTIYNVTVSVMCYGVMSYCDMWWRYVLQHIHPRQSLLDERAECTKTMGGSSSPQSSCEKKEKEFSDRQKPLANIRTTTRIVIAAIINYNVKNSLVHLERPLLSL